MKTAYGLAVDLQESQQFHCPSVVTVNRAKKVLAIAYGGVSPIGGTWVKWLGSDAAAVPSLKQPQKAHTNAW